MKPRRSGRARQDAWRLFLNFAWTCFAGGLLLALIGAWLAAAITFALGLVCALAAGWRQRRTSARLPRPSAPAINPSVRERGRR